MSVTTPRSLKTRPTEGTQPVWPSKIVPRHRHLPIVLYAIIAGLILWIAILTIGGALLRAL